MRYQYDAYGTLEKETDLVNGRIDRDQYDMTGRLVQSSTLEKNTGVSGEPTEANTHTVQSLEIGYDSYDRVDSLVQRLEGSKAKTGFIYGDASKAQRPGLAYGLTVDGVQRQSLTYDAMARRTKETVTLPGGQTRENRFVYGTINHLTDTDSLLSSMSNGTDSWSYEYDNAGNITKITSGAKSISYVYDELNQLIRENNGVLGTTVLYTYDIAGNMTTRKTYAYTTGTPQTLQKSDGFTYRTGGWKDQLMSWNGQPYAYDAGGNPTVLRGVALTWGEGRRLKKVSLSWGDVTFAYDSDGKRVRKSSSGVDTKYFYNGNMLSGLVKTTTGSAGTTKTTVQFVYDAEGKPLLLRLNGKTDYFYLYNGLGDVVGLIDSSNKVVVRYQYDSWGKVTSSEDTSGVSLATLNPFRYRRYIYDPETGLYYLGSRYYDPEVGRFVNADDFETLTYQMDSVQGKNLYQYCFNNPVNMEDGDGGWPKWVTQVAIGVGAIVIGAVAVAATAATGGVAATFAVAVTAGAKTAAMSGVIGAVVGASTSVIGNRISTGSWKNSAKIALNGAVDGFASGFMTGGIMAGTSQVVSSGFKVVAKASVKAGKKVSSGIKVTKNIKILSPDKLYHKTNG